MVDGKNGSIRIEVELRQVRSGWQFDAGRRIAPGLLVELCQLFPHLCGARPNHRILACVVIVHAAEHFNSKRSLFEAIDIARNAVFGNAPEQSLTTAAGSKQWAAEHTFQLGQD